MHLLPHTLPYSFSLLQQQKTSPMDTRFKLRLSRMFQASFGSCRSRNLSDILEKAVFAPPIDDQSFRSTDSMPAKLRPFPSICRPHSEPAQSVASSRKNSERFTLAAFPSAIPGGGTCPAASPSSPLNSFSEFAETVKVTNRKKTKKKKKKKTPTKKNPFCAFSSSSMESNFGGTWWYSSDYEDDDDGRREDETDTLFSSKSRSSDSSASHRRRPKSRRRRGAARQEMGMIPLKGKVKGSFAVVKKSTDPYSDFRTSMLEMIVEKQIFSGKDLEQLLQCFLSLNSHHHHRMILEVFTEIWEALFSDWGS